MMGVKFTQQEWDAMVATFPSGTLVCGEVVSCQMFGVFVRLDQLPEVTALLEVIHFKLWMTTPQRRFDFPTDYPSVGSRLDARILAWSVEPHDVRLTQLGHLDWSHSLWLKEHHE